MNDKFFACYSVNDDADTAERCPYKVQIFDKETGLCVAVSIGTLKQCEEFFHGEEI